MKRIRLRYSPVTTAYTVYESFLTLGLEKKSLFSYLMQRKKVKEIQQKKKARKRKDFLHHNILIRNPMSENEVKGKRNPKTGPFSIFTIEKSN